MVTLKQSPEDFIVNEKMKLTLGGGKHAIFLLKKRDLNTMQVLDYIKNTCNLRDKDIGYAGMKDKIAITTQYISIAAAKEHVLSKDFPFELEYVGQSKQALYIGGLEGNEFIITARDCQKEPRAKVSIINYFGEQRFSVQNVAIGRFLVKKNYHEAVSLVVETQNPFQQKKLKEMLDKDPHDYIGALRNVPLKLIQFYIHAYQSYLWNKVVSELIKKKDKNYLIDDVLDVAVPTIEVQLPPIPLIGFYTDEDVPQEVEEVMDEVLDSESLSARDFINKSMPELTVTGNLRNTIINLSDVKITLLEKNVYQLHFFLPKGSYATVTTRQLLIF